MIETSKLIRGVFLAFALIFVAPVVGFSLPVVGVQAAQAQNITRIEVSGNKSVDKATIISYLTFKVGQPATPAAISSSIDSLYRTGLFKTVRVRASGSTAYVNVTENAKVAAVLFQGNQRFSDAELLTMVQVGVHSGYSPARVQTDVDTIKQAYLSAGYKNVSVTAQTATVDNGRVKVTFVINEGKRSGIVAINFTGNNAVSASTLKSIIVTKETGLLSWLTHDDIYDPNKLEIDKQIIRRYYADHGYPDAQVSSAVAEYDAKRNGYYINFTILEGQHYTFGPSTIETSISGLNTKTLDPTILTDKGSSYSLADLQKTASDMAFKATGEGHPFANVRPRIDRDVANHKFDITYLVDNGPRVYVERINITGNEKTRDFVIRRELGFAEGDAFNQSMVTRAKAAVEKLGFFKSVDITAEPGSAPDKVIVDVVVVEKSTGDYGVTAGYSTQDGILGQVSLTERDFLGRGQYVRAAIGASGTGKTFDFSFTEPRFMGLRISSGIDLYKHIYDQQTTNYYGVNTLGGRLRFGLPLTDTIGVNVFTGLEQKTIVEAKTYTDSNGNAQNYPLYPSAFVSDGETFNKAFVGYGLSYNTLDDNKHPTTGMIATFTQQYAGWDFSYLRTEAKARYYVPLLGEQSGIVGSVKVQGGIINNFKDGGLSPIEAFQPDSTLIRGFESQGIGAFYEHTVPGEEYLGATKYAGLSAEVDFPLPILPESYGLSGALWIDTAYISGVPLGGADMSLGSVDPNSINNDFKASIGTSIIWDSPFGPLRGNFGYVLKKAASDKPQVFQLTLQSAL